MFLSFPTAKEKHGWFYMTDFAAIFLLFHGLLLLEQSLSLPLCNDMRAPMRTSSSLGFCEYSGSVCRDTSKDHQLHNQFVAMNISDHTCASLLKSDLCATCDPFSAELFKVETSDRQQLPVPFLCNSTNSGGSPSSKRPKGLCLEKIGTESYINMAPHPDGSSRAFFSNLPGKIWLGTILEQDSGEKLDLEELDPFVDLTDEVLFDTTFGMLGMAFHPDFAHNGRFFASYNCLEFGIL